MARPLVGDHRRFGGWRWNRRDALAVEGAIVVGAVATTAVPQLRMPDYDWVTAFGLLVVWSGLAIRVWAVVTLRVWRGRSARLSPPPYSGLILILIRFGIGSGNRCTRNRLARYVSVMASLYEFAGGEEALHRLEDTFYTSLLTDPLLQPLLGSGQPQHVDHLTAFTAESFVRWPGPI